MALSSSAVNRVLADEPWARERLAAHAGRAFSLRVGPLMTAFQIDGQGTLASAPLVGTTPDLLLTLSPFNVPAFLADPKRWNEFVTEEGDVELGGTLKELAQTLPWFVEQAFARAFGPIGGQRWLMRGACTGAAGIRVAAHRRERRQLRARRSGVARPPGGHARARRRGAGAGDADRRARRAG
jgi:ubiquinone biosynthesis protein UbiJ